MADMRLVILGAGGRMGRTLVKMIADTPGAILVGGVEQPGSPLIGQDAGVLAGLPANGVKIAPDLKPLLAQAGGPPRLPRAGCGGRGGRTRRRGGNRARHRHYRSVRR